MHNFLPSNNLNELTHEAADNTESYPGFGKVEMSYGLPKTGEFRDDMLAMRQDFVVNFMKWLPEDHREGDDQYDHDPETMHIGIRDYTDDELIAGVRLSRPNSLPHTMSLAMLNNEALQTVSEQTIDGQPALAVFHDLSQRGLLRDMTRLVPNRMKPKNLIAPSMMELFGYAAGIVRSEMQNHDNGSLDEVKWIFATTEDIKFALEYNGVMFHTLVGADFHEDSQGNGLSLEQRKPQKKKKSYFCYVDQEAAIAHIAAHPETLGYALKPLHDGLRKANAL
jgi:hypothetical protein